ncbi:Phosphate acyltransferase [Gemmatirosa kalamazoonensis]|uniref:Phosphate acyltransferase n=2 Tax=Gemmatirosa kalamazoonensis TaxID=861299 RepID=W0RKG6_9BACT|nr:Phosphate acyltransferase [Gemmatirosa kalamazoonensis]
MARVALDAMGGDFAPRATVAGALLALVDLPVEHTIQLVGRTAVVDETLDVLFAGEFAAHRALRDRLEVVDAPDVIEMSDKPTVVRSRPGSSMMVGLRLQADGKSDAFVSAGNTGAQMAASLLVLKSHAGLKRPAIGTLFPTAQEPVVVLDSGANVDCSPEELVQFARLGTVYAQDMLGRRNPAVGLLSIGEEPEKGNAAVKEAHQRLRAEPGIHFVGNVEGRDIPLGRRDDEPLDVVVCDGFVGNVLLKFYEALAPTLMAVFAKALGAERETLRSAFKELDHAEHGGAPLLGVKGVSIISHGSSSPRAIKNAIGVGLRAVESRMSEHIGRRLEDAAAAAERAEAESTSSSVA